MVFLERIMEIIRFRLCTIFITQKNSFLADITAIIALVMITI